MFFRKKRSIRLCAICFIYLFLFVFTGSTFAAKEPALTCSAAVLIEFDTGKVLYDKNMNEPMYPASTTKIMTALLALENLDLKKQITVPDTFGPAEGSAMYLLPGETFTVEELLQGLMIKSANDAAVLLALEISGDIPSFAELMNKRATEIGCTGTHFTNPNGLHDPKHTTTAHDLALMAREAMKHKLFRELIKTDFIQIHATEQTPEIRYYRNTNRFLWSSQKIDYNGAQIPIKYDVVDGVKTGFTDEAKNCLVSTGEKNGIRVIAVSLKNETFEVYKNSRTLLDYGFENFQKKSLVSANEVVGSQEFPKTVEKKLDFYVKDNFVLVENINSNSSYVFEALPKEGLQAPVQKDELIGEYLIKKDGTLIQSLPLYASNSLESIYSMNNILRLAEEYKVYLIAGFIGFVIMFVLLKILMQKLFSRRRKRKSTHINRF